MYVTPDITGSNATAFLVYNLDGNGHYDAALPCHKAPSSVFTNTSCKYGVNKKASTNESCKSSPFYRTRCKCFRADRACTTICRCFNCKNPFGAQPSPAHPKTRTRRKHALEVINIPNSEAFAKQRKETINKGAWSNFETIVLYEILRQQSAEDNLESMYNLYNDIVDNCNTLFAVYNCHLG